MALRAVDEDRDGEEVIADRALAVEVSSGSSVRRLRCCDLPGLFSVRGLGVEDEPLGSFQAGERSRLLRRLKNDATIALTHGEWLAREPSDCGLVPHEVRRRSR